MKITSILNISLNFTAKFAYDYIKYMLKYIFLGIAGFVFLPLINVNPIFALPALFVTIPVVCYCFWRGYVATYALNFAALEFLFKKPLKELNRYVELAKKQEQKLIAFVTFFAIITVVAYLPTVFYFINNFSYESMIIDPKNYVLPKGITIFSIINTLVLAQFLNFALQAFFFKKEENYFTLLIKCYTKTGFSGFIISALIIGITTLLNVKLPFIYLITFLPLNLLIYSFNTIFYFSKIKKENN